MALHAQCPDSQKEIPVVVKLNVGGRHFETRLETLRKYPESMLGAMFSGRYELDVTDDGQYFIDRNGDYFEHILEFLRDSTYLPPKDFLSAVFREADYFALVELRDKIMKLPPIFPFCGDRPDPVPNYMEIKEKMIKEARDFVKATAHGQTIVYLLSLQEEEEPAPDYVYCSEKHHVLKIPAPIDDLDGLFPRDLNEIEGIQDDKAIEFIEDAPPVLLLKADNKDQALSVSNCLFYDLKKHGFDIKMENEICTSKGVFSEFGLKTKAFGEMGCKPCYQHSKFIFLW
ncbi:BTB/POZ domain-containing protein KCTD14-like [Mytilus californianus]|uniref:BTB/POZ domain-containing protein KCTD14-like n=1 Tax=Mytilus californianus TaxID=6549 RepID=UPI00224578F3|nr:BTB/POZ domain-containing protein KCTD14-like [Mytilus californianus]